MRSPPPWLREKGFAVNRIFQASARAPEGGTSSIVDRLIQASSDLAILIAGDGTIEEVHLGKAFARERADEWLGRSWADTVTSDTRSKIRSLLDEVKKVEISRFRQVNQVFADGIEIPVSFTVLQFDGKGRVLALGRDLRALSDLQKQLVDAQQALERDYWRLRQVETRYRLLFQRSSEAVLFLEAGSRRVVDANEAAGRAFGLPLRELMDLRIPEGLDLEPEETDNLRSYLAAVANSGKADPITLTLSEGSVWDFHASLVREDRDQIFLAHLSPTGRVRDDVDHREKRWVQLLENAPDGWVVTDMDARVVAVNRAFLDLVQLSSEEEALGQSLGKWLGRPGADLTVLLANLQKFGVVRLFPTTLLGELDMDTEVELSGILLEEVDPPVVGIVVRNVSRRLAVDRGARRNLTSTMDELTHQVGKVSLKELVQNTTAVVEAHFIEAALELTDDNRTAAAELLGVSRQSLYTKLRRYNLEGPSRDRD